MIIRFPVIRRQHVKTGPFHFALTEAIRALDKEKFV